MGSIRRLPTEVVARIAAGEVVQRPVSVVKELVENSIDADATEISVAIAQGGLKSIQIQDNGKGIQKADLAILCERHTTSKLVEYSDLLKLASYGFRGEALASVSQVAHVSVVTKVAESPCAYKAVYDMGKMVGEPKACAGTQGTTIFVEDLFYNLATRRAVLKYPSDEHRKVEDVIRGYAVQNARIAFSLRKAGQAGLDFRTALGATAQENVGVLFGAELGREVLGVAAEDARLGFRLEGLVSHPGLFRRDFLFLFFVNGRLVSSAELRASLRLTFQPHLSKGAAPFVFLSLTIPPDRVDVNVHPTKKEVKFLNEADISKQICEVVEERLIACSETRNFVAQAGARSSQGRQESTDAKWEAATPKRQRLSDAGQKRRDSQLVRTDYALQKLDKFFHPTPKADVPSPTTAVSYTESSSNIASSLDLGGDDENGETADAQTEQDPTRAEMEADSGPVVAASSGPGPSPLTEDEALRSPSPKTRHPSLVVKGVVSSSPAKIPPPPRSVTPMKTQPMNGQAEIQVVYHSEVQESKTFRDFNLESINQLRQSIASEASGTLREVMKKHTFVGCVDAELSLVQHSTSLFLLNTHQLMRLLFYQVILFRFGNFGKLKLGAQASVAALLRLASGAEALTDDAVAAKVRVLVDKAALLDDYFKVEISADGDLCALPHIISGYSPQLEGLPELLWALSTDVAWTEEKSCLEAVTRALADFYALKKHVADAEEMNTSSRGWEWTVEHVVLPAFRSKLLPPSSAASDGSIRRLTDLHDLYKIFERC